MKKSYLRYFTLLSAFCLISTFTIAQTFVNGAATGANDGSSWADAYTDLNDALMNTTTGEVWVAGGTYHPGADTSSTFLISNPISVYGGFAGTETMLSERDITANTTTLSGDVNEDDTPDDFATNKSDNVRRIVVVDSLIVGGVTIDGFVITKGFGNATANDETLDSGAGLFTYSLVNVNNCTFTQNSASSGSSIYLSPETAATAGAATGSTITNSIFSNNNAVDNAAGIYIVAQADITVDNCTFNNNITNRGVFYPIVSSNITLSNSTFDGNSNPTGAGGAMWNWNSVGFNVTNCTFTNNTATTASVMYFDGRNSDIIDITDMVITDCVFDNNETTGTATGGGVGALWFSRSNFTINNSTFTNNSAPAGAHFYVTGDVMEGAINDCTFSGGQAGRSGVFEVFSDTTTLNITNTTFDNNQSGDISGVMLLSNNAVVNMTGCDMLNNSATTDAGMGWIQGGVQLTMTDCEIAENTATGSYASGFILGSQVDFIDSEMNANVSGDASGFGISNSTDNQTTVNLTNSVITNNGDDMSNFGGVMLFFSGAFNVDGCTFAANQGMRGGAIYAQGAGNTVNIMNSDFLSNQSNIGGALELSGGNTYNVDNCFFEGNSANTGGAIANILFDNNDVNEINISNSIFESNVAEVQGGALNFSELKTASITNSLFSNNINIFGGDPGDGGAGGAMSFNSDSVDMNISMIHNTIVKNESFLGVGIVTSWESDDPPADLTVTMQNNVMYNPDYDNYVIEAGTPILTSAGGNLSEDESGDDDLTDATDQNEVDDMGFISLDVTGVDDNFGVLPTSPAVGAGTATSLTTDLVGFTRADPPTSGAYEFDPNFVSVKETVVPNAGSLKILPNPVNEILTFELTNEWKGDMEVRIYNIQGRLLKSFKVNKGEDVLLQSTNVSNFATGRYDVVISDRKQAVVTRFVKL